MRILAPKQVIFYTLSLIITSSCIHAQDAKVRVSQDPKFEQLLNEKRKLNVSTSVNDRYKIQIFSGDSENAKKTLRSFKQEFSDIDGTIVFNTPNYKVWVGNFKTRIEAERNLIDIRKKYKNVLLIKPSK
ncbi:SPOR domain-containing protein [Flavobacterium xinjiangense]|uniref:Sporulation related domain-containing protein n=1 Tax=Flavobacterium xinjiangense TaxID=178356 RepID=A0A1M7E8Z5_9FLAO|nr:SPOR domain-containing protein [Flavobacterium xinjiangense]SHL88234.1 Sporulation related domain-containing protein [Flavobacterium xinjiangense]